MTNAAHAAAPSSALAGVSHRGGRSSTPTPASQIERSQALFMLPLGRALLDEGARPLDAVRAAEDYAERLLLEAQAGVFFHCECGSQRGFRLAQRDGGLARDFLGQLARRLEQFGGRHDLVREAQLERRLGVEHVAGHYKLTRLVVPDSMRQALRPAKAGDEPEINLGLTETRLVA